MRRRHLFEFTDQSWYPQIFRSIQTDYLQFVTTRGAGHKNLVPLFARALAHADGMQIIDLCSGGGGPWIRLVDQLRDAGLSVNVTLTDKYPNLAVRYQWEGERTGITYLQVPVDASRVPGYLKGMRTMFEGFHHFRPDQAQMILRDAFENKVPLGIFEASLVPPQGPLIFLLSPLMTLLGYFFVTPFIHPRTMSRFLWTYLLPIVPLATCWDGWVSFLRIYSRQELTELIAPLKSDDYVWEIGKASTGTILFSFVYLLGYPQ
jgi:hypothetical protein